MKVCFVSVHGPTETYFVDEPHICSIIAGFFYNAFPSINSVCAFYSALSVGTIVRCSVTRGGCISSGLFRGKSADGN
jgi:hypothetical protein